MFVRKIKSEGLAHLSYIVGSKDEAVVIDPRRDCQVYSDMAREEGMVIRYILETHRNEDYLTGSRELAALTGARILHGSLDFGYGERINDGQELLVGDVKIRAMSTPGHTDESVSYAMIDLLSGDEPVGVFTGDALFVGEVGRVDLMGQDQVQRMAANLYRTLFQKLLPLGKEVIIYPAHGSGSHCGGSISEREESTIGLELVQNHALKLRDEADFVRMKMNEVLEKPWYFAHMERLNLSGQPLLGHLPTPPPLPAKEFQELTRSGAVVLDLRNPAAFASAHIQGTYSVPLEVFPNYVGWVTPYDRPLLLVMEGPRELDSVVRYLIREGYDSIHGYLEEGIEGWYNAGFPVEHHPALTATEVHEHLDSGRRITLLDVRTEKEWKKVSFENTIHIFVGFLEGRLNEVPNDAPVAVFCSSGLRGSLGASILLKNGFKDVTTVLGGTMAWVSEGFETQR